MDDDPLADRRAAVLRVVADQIVVERAEIGLPEDRARHLGELFCSESSGRCGERKTLVL